MRGRAGRCPSSPASRERFASEQPLDGHPRRRVPARDRRDRQPHARAARRAGRRSGSAPPTRCPRRTTWPRRSARRWRCSPIAGEDLDTYAKHVGALAKGRPQITIDDGADLLTVIHAGGVDRRPDRRHRGDHRRPAAPAPPRGRGRPALPGARGERVAHRAHLQRPLRHRPVGARRHRARHQPAARRPHAGAVRLRLHRQGDRRARPRRRRRGDRLRGRPDARAGGPDGGLRGDAGARGRGARRPVRHRHRLARRAARASTSSG